ncbi:MAG: S41 family peptidase [Candidatus Saccharimonadales bacterium]
MIKISLIKKVKSDNSVVEHEKKNLKKNKYITPIIVFIAIAVSLGFGYVAGTYHYQIEAAIGPVFGYKVHSGDIDLSSLQETYNQLAANYDGKLDVNKLVQGANHGMVDAVGDAYTVYMNPEEAVDFNNTLTGSIGGGIGAQIGVKNSKVVIIKPLKDNPAIKAGLKAGDIITKVNDDSTTGWTVDQAVTKIRGEVGTTVKLTILRGTETKVYTITRETINNPSVESSISDGLGVITITRFDGETGDLARAAAQNFVSKGVKKVILDLRGNGGGYVSAAVDVAGLWLDNKTIMTERSDNVIKNTLKSGNNAILSGIETIVLVDGQTASASEIVAGALQDYKAAKLVGEKTFGKGSVQLPVPLSGGGELKVTVARWYTPNGKNITQDGIDPDYVVEYTQSDFNKDIDPQMDKAESLLKA